MFSAHGLVANPLGCGWREAQNDPSTREELFDVVTYSVPCYHDASGEHP